MGALVGVNRPLLAALVPGALLVGLLRGWSWARPWTTVALGTGAVGAAVGVILADTFPHRLASAVTAIGWGLAAVTLERSEAIDAYCERQP